MNPEGLAAIYAALNFISAVVCFLLSIYLIRKPGLSNALSFTLLLWAATMVSLTNGVMVVSRSLELSQFLWNLRWLSLAAIPPLLLIFILDFSGRHRQLTTGWLILYFTIPVLTQLIIWTNDAHHFWLQSGSDAFIQIGQYMIAGERIFAGWFWIYSTWGYLLVLIALFVLIYDTLTTPLVEWVQFIWLFLGFFLPVLFSIVDTFSLLEPSWFKILPLGFMVTGIAFFIAISRGQFINILPIARGYIIETLNDAVYVADRYHRIVDLNPAASLLMGKPQSEMIGQQASEVFSYWPKLSKTFQETGEITTAIRVVRDTSGRYFDTYIYPLRSHWRKSTGWVIVLHEITQLIEAEERAAKLAAVIEQAQETIVITDLDGNITYANPYFETSTGYTVKEALGQNPRILQSGRQDKKFYDNLWGTIAQGESWGGNFINKRKDGSFYHEAATIFPIKNEFEEIINYAAVKRDITAQVVAEEALLNFTGQLEALHEISLKLSQTNSLDELTFMAVKLWQERIKSDRIGIWFVNLENPNHLKGSYGIDEKGAIRDERNLYWALADDPVYNFLKNTQERIYYNPRQALYNHKRDTVGIGEAAVAHLWDGSQIIGYVSIDNYLSKDPITPYQREILLLFAQIVGHLASSKKIEENIQESERQYRLLADNASDVIWTMDLDGNFTYVSPSVKQLRGYTPEEVLGHGLAETLTPKSLKTANQSFEKMLSSIEAKKTYKSSPFELEQLHKDGSTVWTEVITSLMYDKDKIPLGILGVTRNITKRKEAERSLQNYAHQQALLNAITQVAIQQTNLDQMLQTLADRMGELLNADGCYITIWDENTNTVIPAAAYGPMRDSYANSIQPQPGEATLTASVLEREDILVIENVMDSPYVSQRIVSQFPARSGIALPLIANNQKLGAALLAFNYEREYSPNEIELSKQAAQQIALAILKTRLLEEAEQRAREAETLRLASTAIVTTLEQDQAIERILEELNRVVPYDSASVLRIRGNEMEIIGARGFKNPEEILHMRFPVTENTPNKVIFETRQAYILSDAREEYAAFREPPHNHIRGWMGIPLLVRDELIGMLALDSLQPDRFDHSHARLANAFADQVAITLENARLFEETRRLAIIDSLTNLHNRRHFMELARREFARSMRYQIPLSIIMIDIDHFKQINDTYGHLVGDQVLQTIAFICKKNLRSIDLTARFGGEEFILLLPETPLSRPLDPNIDTDDLNPIPAQIVADRLREIIEKEYFKIGKASISVTISLGVAELTSTDKNIETIINHADQALLDAKNQGRNQVVIWQEEDNLAENSN